MKFNPTLLELLILIFACLQVYLHGKYYKRLIRWWRERRKRRRGARHLRPRDPSPCPQCVGAVSWLVRRPTMDEVLWEEVKSRAGRPKTVDTNGCACLNVACEYYGIADATVHALVSDGQRNGVQYWRCQACGGRKTTAWVHVRGPSRQRDRTPAMVAGLTSKGWTVADSCVCPYRNTVR